MKFFNFVFTSLLTLTAFAGSVVSPPVTITGTVTVDGDITVVSSVLPTGAATELTLSSILTNTNDIEGYVDGIEGLLGTGNTSLANIDSILATASSTLTAILGAVDSLEDYFDGVEGLLTAGNASTSSIDTKLSTTNTQLTSINANTDTLEALIGTTNSALTTIDGRVDQLEGYADGIEGLIGTTNTTLSTGIATMLDRHTSGSLAAGDTTSVIGPLATNGASSIGYQATGTFTGSIVVETTTLATPGASDWTAVRCYNDTTSISQNPIITGIGSFDCGLGNATFVRARRSNSGTGTAVIELNVSAAPAALKVVSPNFNDFMVSASQGSPGALANAWYTRITDATNGPVAVKAASTAALATDPALVVAISPNNTIAVTQSGTWTEANSASILGAVNDLEGYTDGIEGLLTSGNANTSSIDSKLTTTNSSLTSILGVVDQLEGYTDGIEGLLTTGNSNTASIDTKLSTTNSTLTTIDGRVDGLETLVGTTNSTLTTINSNVDGVESSLTSIDGKFNSLGQKLMAGSVPVVISSDQSPLPITGTITSTGGALEATQLNVLGAVDQLEGYTDGIEALLGTANTNTSAINSNITTVNTNLTSILGVVDQLEGYTDGVEGLIGTTNSVLTTIDSRVDGLEGYTDGLETLVTATNTNQLSGSQKTQLVDGAGTVVGPAQNISGTNYAPVVLAASATPGAAVVPRSIQIAGSDGTNAQTIATDSAGTVKTLLYAKNKDTLANVQVLADSTGRLVVSPEAAGTKVDVVRAQSLAAGAIDYYDYTVGVGQNLQLSLLYGGGVGTGSVALARHNTSATNLVTNGSFENAGQVTPWAAATGTFTAPTPDSNSTQFFLGAASMRWTYTNSATALRRNQTLSPAMDFTGYRYLSARFFNDAAAAGANRTVSIILTGTGTSTYSLTGALGSAPFTSNTWILAKFDLSSPTSITAGGADLTAVTQIALVMQDSANRAGTVYWDAVQQEDSLTYLHRMYFPANSTSPAIAINPTTDFTAGESFYLITKSTNNTKAEYTSVVKGVLQ